jgi:rhodanese-related sulfurtransferase
MVKNKQQENAMLKMILIASVSLGSAVALACDGTNHAAQVGGAAAAAPAAATTPAAPVKAAEVKAIPTVTVEELAAMLDPKAQKKAPVTVVDCNGVETRSSSGVIPGAVLLGADPLAGMPKNKADAVVFYCSNEQCGASKQAAGKAAEAGFTNVKVLPAGIAGWLKAGKTAEKKPLS